MRIAKTFSFTLLLICLLLMLPPRSSAQDLGELQAGGDFNFVRANAPAGGCGCFSMKGGDGWVAWQLNRHLAIVGQGAVQHASNINGTTAGLTLTSFVGGPRVTFHPMRRLVPFAQALFGGAHGSGLLTPSQTTGQSGSANAFAAVAGGGVDFYLTEHIGLRAIQVDYYYTHFQNGTNDRQNNLKVSAGIFWNFGRR